MGQTKTFHGKQKNQIFQEQKDAPPHSSAIPFFKVQNLRMETEPKQAEDNTSFAGPSLGGVVPQLQAWEAVPCAEGQAILP